MYNSTKKLVVQNVVVPNKNGFCLLLGNNREPKNKPTGPVSLVGDFTTLVTELTTSCVDSLPYFLAQVKLTIN